MKKKKAFRTGREVKRIDFTRFNKKFKYKLFGRDVEIDTMKKFFLEIKEEGYFRSQGYESYDEFIKGMNIKKVGNDDVVSLYFEDSSMKMLITNSNSERSAEIIGKLYLNDKKSELYEVNSVDDTPAITIRDWDDYEYYFQMPKNSYALILSNWKITELDNDRRLQCKLKQKIGLKTVDSILSKYTKEFLERHYHPNNFKHHYEKMLQGTS